MNAIEVANDESEIMEQNVNFLEEMTKTNRAELNKGLMYGVAEKPPVYMTAMLALQVCWRAELRNGRGGASSKHKIITIFILRENVLISFVIYSFSYLMRRRFLNLS